MRHLANAGHVNISAAVTEAGAGATKNAPILQIAPAIHVGTDQAVFQNPRAVNIGVNQMCFIMAPAIILAIPGFATKEAAGRVPARLLSVFKGGLGVIRAVYLLIHITA